jgi:LacI family transcriptional regulator/LacI family repressor for deo operon, udp, cdd, tsx, nupC, and nupG
MPKDIALVGYDDIPWATALHPPPTVVNHPGYEMGQRAAELLMQRIKEPKRSSTLVTLQPELILRDSCGANSVDTPESLSFRSFRIS